MKKWIKRTAASLLAISAVAFGAVGYTGSTLSDHYSVFSGDTLSFGSTGLIGSVVTGSGSEHTATSDGSYQVDVKLFGMVPVKKVSVDVVDRQTLVPCGTPFGVKMFTQGVLVVSMSDVETANGTVNPAKQAGIQVGDVITRIEGKQVNTNEQVSDMVEHSNGQPLKITAIHKNETYETTLTPVVSTSHTGYRAGIWVRDSSAGIGTLTFYSPETGVFGGLGHAICDVDTGEIMPLMTGEVVDVSINDVIKAKAGSPGELRGSFSSATDMGRLIQNSETGIYGVLFEQYTGHEAMPIALKQEVKEGDAEILATIDGDTPKKYSIKIEKVSFSDKAKTKNMVVKVTDSELLEKTGGIVQGMSGSPIIQDGHLVGAVTHVFVNDPTRGYGIFIENMLDGAQEIIEEQQTQ